jgi:hypothetical protein
MKTTFLTLFFALFALISVQAQNPPASPRVTAQGPNVKVEYGQPSKKGRVIFGKADSQSLVKYGEMWRIGANQATEITFTKNGKFAGKDVKAGTYSFFAIPGEKEWTIILNSELGQWGSYKYEEIKAKDVLRVNVPVKKFKDSAEKLTFKVNANAVEFQWDKEGFSVPVKF